MFQIWTNLLSVGHMFYSVLVMCASLSAFQSFFCHRQLNNNALTGPIPSEISTLTKLYHLYAPSLIEVIECWSCIYWVLVMRAFSQPFKRSAFRCLCKNKLTLSPMLKGLCPTSDLAPCQVFHWQPHLTKPPPPPRFYPSTCPCSHYRGPAGTLLLLLWEMGTCHVFRL